MSRSLTVGVFDELRFDHFELSRRAKVLGGPGGELLVGRPSPGGRAGMGKSARKIPGLYDCGNPIGKLLDIIECLSAGPASRGTRKHREGGC